jgi:phosphoadenosine phosphosulfate reductase
MLYDMNIQLKGLSPAEGLATVAAAYPGKVIFTTSFSLEDQVILDLITNLPPDLPGIRIATLDTGRLFEETYKVFSQSILRFPHKIEVYYPDATQVEKLLTEKGPYSFYESIENRKECCNIRKVLPLQRALAGMECWVTGIRADHSVNRKQMPIFEYDEANKLYKYHPLLQWDTNQVKEYIRSRGIPYNVLYDRGFPSIGCAPCTRSVNEGEDPRAGRWWWEQSSGKECGLHTVHVKNE